MHISKIKLTNFKNFTDQEFTFVNGFNFIVGGNGQGKTNVLDAIYNCSFAKSYMLVSDSDLVKYESTFYRTEGLLSSKKMTKKFAISYQKGKKKRIEFDEQSINRYSSHIGNILCVMIAPDEQKIIHGSSEERRKLIDNAISQIDAAYLEKIIKYQAVLDQRNALLKNLSNTSNPAELFDIYDKQLSELAGFIFQKRKQFIEEINTYFKEYYLEIAQKSEEISFGYDTDLHSEILYDILLRTFEKDKILEYTSKGIHRDDIKIIIDQNPIKKFASQGQQKSFIISIKLAICKYLFLRKNEQVILLFDDLFDKLDENRCERLMKLLLRKDFFTQVFFTDTNRDRIVKILDLINAKSHTSVSFFNINNLNVVNEKYI